MSNIYYRPTTGLLTTVILSVNSTTNYGYAEDAFIIGT